MRQSHSFLLTVIIPDDHPEEVRGRVQFIATGHEAFFTDLAQLAKFLRSEINDYQAEISSANEALPQLKGKPAASRAG
jgi:hypothetical protein